DFVERHSRVESDAALGRTERDVVLDPVAGEDFDLAVVHLDRTGDRDLTFRVGEDLPDARLEIEDACGSIELLEHRVENRTVRSRHEAPSPSAPDYPCPAVLVKHSADSRRRRKGSGGYNVQCMKTVAESGKARWQHETLEPALKKSPERATSFTTISGRPIDPLYTAEDVEEIDYTRDVNNPGVFPYTRGIHPTGYRGKLWTMRQFAGFGTPEDTNGRYKTLLKAGGTGLSVAFDLPTLMGRDPDHELSLGEVGKCGVSIVSLADMERLFDGITLADVTTSMTINSPAPMIFAMYLAVAEKQGADWKTLSGTIQNDILKEFIAQKEYIFPPRQSMRLITDIFAFCATEVPKWNTISVSGYHIREAGSTSL